MIDGSKSEPPFCVRSWLKKIEKKIVCRKVLLGKNCLQRYKDKKKCLQREIFHPPLQKNNGPSLKEKIFLYEDVILYEDELADNGIAKLNVKMVNSESSFFLNTVQCDFRMNL